MIRIEDIRELEGYTCRVRSQIFEINDKIKQSFIDNINSLTIKCQYCDSSYYHNKIKIVDFSEKEYFQIVDYFTRKGFKTSYPTKDQNNDDGYLSICW